MRNPERINRICDELKVLWHKVPDWRLGQVISNLVGNDSYIFYIEDDVMEHQIELYIKEL